MTAPMQEILLPTNKKQLFGSISALVPSDAHFVNGRPIIAPYADESDSELDLEEAVLGLGCFWGAERKFWNVDGVYLTAVGYAAGATPNPTYQQVCSGATGHAEVVLIVFDRNKVSFEELLKVFFESHNPTQGMRQGNDIGSQYRSGIYCVTEQQLQTARKVSESYQAELKKSGYPAVTTESKMIKKFYYAEEYHQQYLAKNPAGYCGIGGTGVTCAI